MQIPTSVLKKMALGAGGLALTAGAAYAVTAPAVPTQPGDAPGTPEGLAQPVTKPAATPAPAPTPRPYDPCLGCGMG